MILVQHWVKYTVTELKEPSIWEKVAATVTPSLEERRKTEDMI